MPVIETNKLCKSYGRQQVLHSVDMQIGQGRLVGFLGPNGAGKTTTIRILMGLLARSSGSATIFGQQIEGSGKQIRREIGYLPGDVNLYSNMTGLSFLQFLANARRRDCMSEAARLASVLDLDLDKRIRKFSTGMRQKLGLIQALMHKPQLLILDEPTSSLDPLIRNEVFAELRKVTEEGRTVLFSSHSLDEVEALCDEVIILRDGHIVEQQQVEVLKQRAMKRIQVVFGAGHIDLSAAPAELAVFSFEDNVLNGTWTGQIQLLLGWFSNHDVTDIIIERPDLNDLFISYYTSDSTGEKRNSP
jgi:ABC-2 type transport system ATP-binding protein